MHDFMIVILYLFLPMGLVQLIYRIIDRKINITKALVVKYPIIKIKKNLIQVFGTVSLVLVIGIVGYIFGIPREIYFVIAGSIAGFVNGVALSITLSE